MNKIKNKKIFLSLLTIFVFLPQLLFASNIYFTTKEKELFVGDNIVVNVLLDSQGKEINAVDGKIFFDYDFKNISVGDVSVAGSDFTLWAKRPTLSMNEREVSFVGGVPEGIKSKNVSVLKIILNLEKPGRLSIRTSDTNIYLNDGKGTRDVLTSSSFDIDILPKPEGFESRREWLSVLEKDTNPPEPFEIFLGQEGSVFDGKKFISFNAIDNESGVSYYEVIENGFPPVRSGNIYVLQEQYENSNIKVVAYDFSGNFRESVFENKKESPSVSRYYMFLFVILIIIFFYWYKRTRKFKNEISEK